MSTPEINPQATPAMVVLRQGDRVLVALSEELDEPAAGEYLIALRSHFPGVLFVLVSSCIGLAVQPGKDIL